MPSFITRKTTTTKKLLIWRYVATQPIKDKQQQTKQDKRAEMQKDLAKVNMSCWPGKQPKPIRKLLASASLGTPQYISISKEAGNEPMAGGNEGELAFGGCF